MNQPLRHMAILDYLEKSQQISVPQLVKEFNISAATARRDINVLHQQGQVNKVRNGALHIDTLRHASQPSKNESQLSLLASPASDVENAEEKERIAQAAAKLCGDGQNVIINCGTTAFMMGAKLAKRDVQVITNYLPLANHLIEAKHEKVVILGGQYIASSASTLSPFTEESHLYSASYMFTSGTSLSPQGLTKLDPLAVMTEQKMMTQADKLVALMDSRKLGMRCGLQFCPATAIHTLITGREADPRQLDLLFSQGVEIVLA